MKKSKNARVARPAENRPIATPEALPAEAVVRSHDGQILARIKAARPWKVIAISTYEHNLEELDAKVAELKARGFSKANRSWLIRVAIAKLDLDTVTKADCGE